MSICGYHSRHGNLDDNATWMTMLVPVQGLTPTRIIPIISIQKMANDFEHLVAHALAARIIFASAEIHTVRTCI